jgi:hypothetical protein
VSQIPHRQFTCIKVKASEGDMSRPLSYLLQRLAVAGDARVRAAARHVNRTASLEGCPEYESLPEPTRRLLQEQCDLLARATQTGNHSPVVVGIDIGFRNLAVCVRRDKTILVWECVDVLALASVAKRPVAALLHWLVIDRLERMLQPYLSTDTLLRVEQQPKHRLRASANAAIAEAVLLHFSARCLVTFAKPSCTKLDQKNTVPASKKRKRYQENKSLVVEHCKHLLEGYVLPESCGADACAAFLDSRAKADDFADAALLTIL